MKRNLLLVGTLMSALSGHTLNANLTKEKLASHYARHHARLSQARQTGYERTQGARNQEAVNNRRAEQEQALKDAQQERIAAEEIKTNVSQVLNTPQEEFLPAFDIQESLNNVRQ